MAIREKNLDNPIIVALDGMTVDDALAMSTKLGDSVWGFKANDLLDRKDGLTLLIQTGANFGLFADPKFHDIPNTVRNRVGNLISTLYHNIDFLTVHASGGVPMMRAAVEAVEFIGCGTNILAVTVLTSLGEDQCNLTFGAPVKAKVLQFARNALVARAHGIVCSGKELEFLAGFPELDNLIKVVAGIRFAKGDEHDQARVMTPGKAIKLGADYLVIGRTITNADDPVAAAQRALDEVKTAREEMTET